ncbi:hypothetical protein C1646_767459 [Rhizophagus diaphanus]|nr:hypothetical protein C1646_767459 [Rhizophagus diaphanus] [Rhizophagus sp. MUCL 43196]
MCNIYGSSNSLHPCHFCLIDRNAMNDIYINEENIKICNEDDTKAILHHSNGQNGPIKILEERLSQIPRYPNLKIFKSGIERLNQLTASEYCDLMKIILFVLDGLILDKKLNKNLCDLYSLWIDIWYYHLIPSICQFDASNSFTSETYKLLHKTNVKQPYHQLKNTQDLIDLWIHGFEKLKSCIYDYFQDVEEWTLQEIENETIQIEVFEFAYLDNDYKIIIRASPNYYGQTAFSNICVEMDESKQNDYLSDNGLCYAKILLILQISLDKLDQNLDLILVQWYDFAYPNNMQHYYFYKCAILKYVDHYTLIPITLITNIVHIIPNFNELGIFM